VILILKLYNIMRYFISFTVSKLFVFIAQQGKNKIGMGNKIQKECTKRVGILTRSIFFTYSSIRSLSQLFQYSKYRIGLPTSCVIPVSLVTQGRLKFSD